MKKIYKSFYPVLALLTVLSITCCSSCSRPRTFSEFTDSVFINEITSNTLNLHYTIQDPAGLGIRDYAISLGSCSPEHATAAKAGLNKLKSQLLSFPYDTLSREEQLTYDILMDYLDTHLALSDFSLYGEPLSFSGGVQVELPLLLAEYPFRCEQDVKDYLKLLPLMEEYLLETISFEKSKAAAGLFMSDELVQCTIDSCKAMLAETEEHFLIQTFENRIENLQLSSDKKNQYKTTNACIVTENLLPVYRTLILELEKLLGSGRNTGGLCHLPKGKEYYELLVYASTGTRYDMETLFKKIERARHLDLLLCADLYEQNPAFFEDYSASSLSFDTPDMVLKHLQEQMQEDFPAAPSVSCRICPVDTALSDYLAPAFYIVAPLDDYQNHSIYINGTPEVLDIYYYTTLAHEGFPGHLYQTVMSYEYQLPLIRNILNYPGFVEGWATYVEMLSYSYSGLHPDFAAMLAHNQSAILSLYATADIGLHYYGWTPEETYQFWASYGITDRETINEITRLILAEPGNYLTYYVGYLEFLDLKNIVRKETGTAFSLKEFHRALLDIGPAPFAILEKYLPYYLSGPQTCVTTFQQASKSNLESCLTIRFFRAISSV